MKITGHENFRFQVYSPRGRHCFLARSGAREFNKVTAGLGNPGTNESGVHALVVGCGKMSCSLRAAHVPGKPWLGTF